ncbi:hypothetical protein J1N35_034691 [Gossypium stocksii]|uniref:Uncharacterized protein n=1 Tax=Gossypium stocksii TaxID=47602 RepID=A0A9D3USH5_9ROSI|nr:hypothetical protein J1N35_034691 [Gossypium stocksii]
MFFISLLLRYMYCSNVIHFKATKRVPKYVKVTLSYGIKYVKENELKLTGFTYNDWAGSVKDMKSTSGSGDQLVDILTKPLGKIRFERLRHNIGVRNIMSNEECCEVAIYATGHKAASPCKLASSSRVARSKKTMNSSKAASITKVASSSNMRAQPRCDPFLKFGSLNLLMIIPFLLKDWVIIFLPY